jgi:hypothetical protein
MMAMLGIYYTDTWGAKSQPFMSTQLRSQSGKRYPISKVFVGGVLDEEALQKNGIPRLTGSFAYGLFMANAAVSPKLILLLASNNKANLVDRSALSSLTLFCSGVVTSSVPTKAPEPANMMTDTTYTWQRTTRRSHGGGIWPFSSLALFLVSSL